MDRWALARGADRLDGRAMTRDLADAELLRRIAARDRVAGAEFFDRHAADVFAYLRRHLDASESEDLLQEVFVRALRRASSFRAESSVRTWLRAIARYALYEAAAVA
jgi:RNA polymerase sigma-70 factor (ECF subfamily)